jgi:hypothetical protein
MNRKHYIFVSGFIVCSAILAQNSFDGFDEKDPFVKGGSNFIQVPGRNVNNNSKQSSVVDPGSPEYNALMTNLDTDSRLRFAKLKQWIRRAGQTIPPEFSKKLNPMELHDAKIDAELRRREKKYGRAKSKKSCDNSRILCVEELKQDIHKARNLIVKFYLHPGFNDFTDKPGEQRIKKIEVSNLAGHSLHNLVLDVKTNSLKNTAKWTRDIKTIKSHQTLVLNDVNIPILHKAFDKGKNQLSAEMKIRVKYDHDVIYASSINFDILAFKKMFLDLHQIEKICNYVRPDSKAVDIILRKLKSRLRKLTGTDSFEQHDFYNLKLVKIILEAIHITLQKDFEIKSMAQALRIRSLRSVIKLKQGGSFDLALLEAAIIERLGLHPIIIITPTNVSVGCWLSRKTLTNTVNFISNDYVLNKVRAEMKGEHFIFFDSMTLTNDGKSGSFESAIAEGLFHYMKSAMYFKKGKWLIYIDVNKYRKSKN